MKFTEKAQKTVPKSKSKTLLNEILEDKKEEEKSFEGPCEESKVQNSIKFTMPKIQKKLQNLSKVRNAKKEEQAILNGTIVFGPFGNIPP